MWPAVWPGVSSTRTSCAPNLKRVALADLLVDAGHLGRLAARPDDRALGLGLERQVAVGVVGVVVGGQNMRERPALVLQRGGHRLGVGRVDGGREPPSASRISTPIIVGEARKLVNLELGHGRYSRAFACFFAVETHPNSAILRIQPSAQGLRRRSATAGRPHAMHRRRRASRFLQRPAGRRRAPAADAAASARAGAARRARQLMGLGFAVPYIGMFRGEAARLGALMPANQGALVWPRRAMCHTVMVEEAMLPLADASRRPAARRALPGGVRARRAAAARDVARAGARGPAAAVVPNRRGIWARSIPRRSATAGPTAAASSSGC